MEANSFLVKIKDTVSYDSTWTAPQTSLRNSPSETKSSEKGAVFIGSTIALLQRFLGGVLCTVAPGFLIVGIVSVGVRWDMHFVLAIVLLIFCLFLLFLLEGTQIAVVRLKEGGHIPPHVYVQAPRVANLLEEMGEDGVAMYLIGRQVLVCANVYIVAALTELSDPLISRFFTIIAGILTVVCYGQLVPQLMADIDPITFFDIWGVTLIIQISTFISRCGIGHFSYWLGTLFLGCMKKKEAVETAQEAEECVDQTNFVQKDNYAAALALFKNLSVEPALKATDSNHIPPHILLAVALGLTNGNTAEEARKLLSSLSKSDIKNDVLAYLESQSLLQKSTQC